MQRSMTRSMTRQAMVVDDTRSATDACARSDSTAESFHSLMTLSPDKEQSRRIREQNQHQSDVFRTQIYRQQRCTINPHSKYMSRWDIVTTLALLFTALVTPFEVCVLDAGSLEDIVTDPLAWINRIVDLIFVIDVGLNCFLTYRDWSEKGGGTWVYDNRKIFIRKVF